MKTLVALSFALLALSCQPDRADVTPLGLSVEVRLIQEPQTGSCWVVVVGRNIGATMGRVDCPVEREQAGFGTPRDAGGDR